MGGAKRVLLGAIAGAHGVRGHVKVKAFTAEPEPCGIVSSIFLRSLILSRWQWTQCESKRIGVACM